MTKKIEKIFIITVFTMLTFLNVSAFELENPVDKNDSIYKYNAIENDSISPDLVNNVLIESIEQSPDIESVNKNDFTFQLEDLLEKQNSILVLLEDAKNEINNRGEIKSFLIGNNLGKLNFQTVQVNNLIFRYNDLLSEKKDEGDLDQIDHILNQTKLLKEKQIELENYILEKDKHFSLFGWLATSI